MNTYSHTAGDRTPYTYLLKFKPTGQVYYGSKTCKGCHPSNLFNFSTKHNYTSSSALVNALIEQFGQEAFAFEIRKIFDDKKKCLLWESRILEKFDVEHNPIFLNLDSKQQSYKAIQNNTKTKFIFNRKLDICIRVPIEKPLPPERELGNMRHRDGPPKTKDKIWIYNLDNDESSMVKKDHVLQDGWAFGRPKGDSSSKTLKSKQMSWMTNGIESRQVSAIDIPNLDSSWKPGRTLEPYDNSRGYTWIFINNGIRNRHLPVGEEIPEGWIKGMTKESRLKGVQTRKANQAEKGGFVWIKKELKSKQIHKNDLQQYIKDGWIKGRNFARGRPTGIPLDI